MIYFTNNKNCTLFLYLKFIIYESLKPGYLNKIRILLIIYASNYKNFYYMQNATNNSY